MNSKLESYLKNDMLSSSEKVLKYLADEKHEYMALVRVVKNESYTTIMLSGAYNDSQFAADKYEMSQKELDHATEYMEEHRKETDCR